jgi:predicted phosphodiesterase
MLPDFEMIVHKFPARDDITIIPIADVHLGARECMEQEFISFINSIADKPNVYVCLLGDLLNNAVKSSVSNIYEELYRPSEAKRMMAKILEPIRDRILFSVTGNHERRSSREVDADINADIMCKLDLEHLHRENVAFVKLQFGNVSGNGLRNPTYTIVGMHGAGGGALTGASVNRNERTGYAIDNMDALIVGHSHRPAVTQPGKIYIDTRNNTVKIKPFKVITATSWLNWGGYSAQKQLILTTHALQTLTLRGDHKEMVVTM